jgi:hypothetical protein
MMVVVMMMIIIIIIIIIIKEIGVKLDNEHWYDHVTKSVETSQNPRLPYYGTIKSAPTELFLTINRKHHP